MIKTLTRVGLAGVMLAVCLPGSPQANFQYIPGSDSNPVGPAMEAPVPVTVTRLPAPQMEPQTAPMLDQANSGGEVIEGFGNQVPLVIALREIVPASYQFAYADGINLGTLVNWKGGRPWRDVLQSVVMPMGLVAVEKNAIVYVNHTDAVMGKTQ